jgi:hypothetical protein
VNDDDFAALFGAVCDVVERTCLRMPLEHADEAAWRAGTVTDNDPLCHTSDAARAAARRIFEILATAADPAT